MTSFLSDFNNGIIKNNVFINNKCNTINCNSSNVKSECIEIFSKYDDKIAVYIDSEIASKNELIDVFFQLDILPNLIVFFPYNGKLYRIELNRPYTVSNETEISIKQAIDEVNEIGKNVLSNNDFKYRNLENKLQRVKSDNFDLELSSKRLELERIKIEQKLNSNENYSKEQISSLRNEIISINNFNKIEVEGYFNSLSDIKLKDIQNEVPTILEILEITPEMKYALKDDGFTYEMFYIFTVRRVILKVVFKKWYDKGPSDVGCFMDYSNLYYHQINGSWLLLDSVPEGVDLVESFNVNSLSKN